MGRSLQAWTHAVTRLGRVLLLWEQDDFSWTVNDGHKELRGKEEGRGNRRERGRSNFHSDGPIPCCSPVLIPLTAGFIPTAAL